MRNQIADQFARNLLAARERANMSQEEVAARASLHRTEISLLERGERVPRIDTIVKLTGALGIKASVLVEGIAWNPGAVIGGGNFQIQKDPGA